MSISNYFTTRFKKIQRFLIAHFVWHFISNITCTENVCYKMLKKLHFKTSFKHF